MRNSKWPTSDFVERSEPKYYLLAELLLPFSIIIIILCVCVQCSSLFRVYVAERQQGWTPSSIWFHLPRLEFSYAVECVCLTSLSCVVAIVIWQNAFWNYYHYGFADTGHAYRVWMGAYNNRKINGCFTKTEKFQVISEIYEIWTQPHFIAPHRSDDDNMCSELQRKTNRCNSQKLRKPELWPNELNPKWSWMRYLQTP